MALLSQNDVNTNRINLEQHDKRADQHFDRWNWFVNSSAIEDYFMNLWIDSWPSQLQLYPVFFPRDGPPLLRNSQNNSSCQNADPPFSCVAPEICRKGHYDTFPFLPKLCTLHSYVLLPSQQANACTLSFSPLFPKLTTVQ